MAPKANMPPWRVKGTGARNHISAQSAINEGNNNPNRPAPVTRVDSKVTRYADPGAEVNVPMADQGQPIPYLIGRRMMAAPCTIWTGIPQTEQTVERTVIEATYETVARGGAGLVSPGFFYEYRLTPVDPFQKAHDWFGDEPEDEQPPEETVTIKTTVDYALALCLGPGVSLMGVYDENGNTLSSTITGPGQQFDIAPSVGSRAVFYGGEWDQPRDPTIAAQIPNTPAYRGIAYVVITSAVLDDGSPLASVFFECVRPVNYLGLTDAAQISGPGLDMNIANAICDLLTNDWGSIGLPGKYIDNVTFTAAAVQLANEGNWCSVSISEKTSIKNVIGGLTAQANGCIRWNPKVGMFQFILFREAEDVLLLPLFDKTNAQSISGLSKQTWYGLPQGINFSFIDRNERYNSATVLVGLNREAEHADVILSETFDSVCEPEVASVVIKETFKRLVTPLLTGTVLANRDAETLFPGDPIRITKENARGITNFPMRITRMRETGKLFDTYSMSVTQDVFPYRKSQFDVPGSTAPNTTQEPVLPTEDQIDIYDAPLFFLNRVRGLVQGATINDDIHVLHLMVRNNAMFYAKQYSATGYQEAVSMGNPTPRGVLASGISEFDGYDVGELAQIVIDGIDFPGKLAGVQPDFDRGTGGLLRIGNELMFFNYGYRTDENQFTAYAVQRGVVDTVPMDHAAGAGVDFILDYTATSRYAATDTIDLQIKGVAGFNSTPDETLIYGPTAPTSRAKLPACPHNGQVNSTGDLEYSRPDRAPVVRGQTYKAVWNERSRQSARIARRETNQPPGEVTTYTLHIRTDNHYYQLATGITGRTADITIPPEVYAGNGTIEIRANTANGASLYLEKIRLTIS